MSFEMNQTFLSFKHALQKDSIKGMRLFSLFDIKRDKKEKKHLTKLWIRLKIDGICLMGF